METNEVAQEMRFKEWAECYQDYKQSGMTIKVWCNVHGISESTFRYRNRRLRKALAEKATLPVTSSAPVAFAKLDPPAVISGCGNQREGVHISLEGKTVDISPDIPPEYFRTLLEVIFHA